MSWNCQHCRRTVYGSHYCPTARRYIDEPSSSTDGFLDAVVTATIVSSIFDSSSPSFSSDSSSSSSDWSGGGGESGGGGSSGDW